LASKIGSMRVDLGIDTAQFETGLKKAQGSLGSFGKIAAVGLAAAAAGAIAVSAALAAGIGNALNAADDMGKMAQKVGVGVTALSELKYAADLSDVSTEQLGVGLKKLGANMAAVAGGAKGPAANAFKALGLSATDAAGQLKAPDAMFKEIAGKFAGMQDGAGKTALAMAIFGKSGADLIPMLNSGSTGLAAMAEEARALGVVIDEKTAKAAETFNDNITRLKTATGGITVQLAAGLAPALASITDVMVSVAKNTNVVSAVSGFLSNVLKGLVTAVVILGAAWKAQLTVITTVASAFMKVVKGDFAGAWGEIAKGAKSGVADFRGAAGMVQKIWADTGAGAAGAAPSVSEAIAAPIMQAAGKVKKAVAEIGRAIRLVDPETMRLQLDTSNAHSGDLTKLRVNAPVIFEVDPASTARVNDAIDDINNGLAEAAQRAQEAFDDAFFGVASSFDQLFNSLSRKNWVGAAAGLIGAAKAISAAFKGGGTAGKIGAVAGAADAVGQAVGGVGGSALSGAAGGAMIGLQLGGPIGAAAGAVIGGIMGIFSGSKAKKAQKAAEAKAKADEAARVAAEEAARAQTVANSKRALDIQLMELSGDAAGALKARREDERAAAVALDPALGELTDKLFAAEDAATLAAKQTEEAAAAEAALADLRADLQDKIDTARDALSEAYEREADVLNATKDKFTSFADDIGAAIAGLTEVTGANALAEFKRAGFLAKLGDENALGKIGGLAPAAADAVRSSARNATEMARGLAGIRLTLVDAQGAALTQASVADQQLAELKDRVGPYLLDINATAQTVNDSIAELTAAQLALDTTLLATVNNNAALVAEINAMREEARINAAALIRNTGDTASTLRGATTEDGLVLNTAP